MEILAALSGLKSALDLARLAIDARDDAKIKTALAEVSELYIAALTAAADSAKRFHDLQTEHLLLKDEQRDLRHRIEERSKYRLEAIGPGVFCYRADLDEASGEPAHFLCQPCYDRGIKAILRLMPRYTPDDQAVWSCPENGGHDLVVSK
jgi:hypothetical protein